MEDSRAPGIPLETAAWCAFSLWRAAGFPPSLPGSCASSSRAERLLREWTQDGLLQQQSGVLNQRETAKL